MIQLRPSSAPIWVHCAAQPRLAERVPDPPESDPAREGTCAAWVADSVLKGEFPDCKSMLGMQHTNGWVVDPAMTHHIQGYVDKLRKYGGIIDTERKVRLNNQIAGTPDASALIIDYTLIVTDLKYGFDPVEPWTEQIAIYAGAIVRQFFVKGIAIRKVVLGIYQPRAYHPNGIHRTITITPESLMVRVKAIEAAGVACDDPNALATPGPHCEYCKAASICSAVTHANYAIFHKMHNAQARHMTAAEMSAELAFLELADDLLKGRKNAIHAEAEARMSSGESIPGWHKESGFGKRRWKYDAAFVKLMTGVDPTAGKMVTPAELERKNASPEIIAMLTETPRTKATIKPVPQGFYAAKFGE